MSKHLSRAIGIGVLLCCRAGALSALAQQAPSASPESQMRRAEVREVEALLPALADRGAALFFVARRYPQFEPLRSRPEFQSLVQQAESHYLPVHRAQVAYTISQNDLFPEGLAVDPGRHVF